MIERYQKAWAQSKTKGRGNEFNRSGETLRRRLHLIRHEALNPSGMEALQLQMSIDMLRRQHEAIQEMGAKLVGAISSYRDEYDAIALAPLIGKLNALLRVHFAYEDSVLYPLMRRSGDAQAADLACRFGDDMGALAPQFEEFVRRWSGPTVIAGMFNRFRDEATTLFAALGARIERENDQLYPLAERVNAALGA
jgi:hemerythrin-like domain-containing protein